MGTAAAREPVLLYTSDWSGTRQVYAVHGLPRRPRLAQLTRGRPARCTDGHPCGYDRVIASPDGRWIAYWDFVTRAYWRWQLFVAAANGDSPRRLVESNSLFREAAWSPDSRRLAYFAEDGVHIVGRDGRGHTKLRGHPPLRWSPDGRYLAFRAGSRLAASPARVVVAHADTLELRVLDGGVFAWSRSGRWLAIRDDGDVFVVRPDGSGRRRVAAASSEAPAWSVGDRYLAITGTRTVAVATVATGAVRVFGVGGSVAWSPTRAELAVAGDTAVSLVSLPSGTIRTLAPDPARELAWAPDGDRLAYETCRRCPVPLWWADTDLRFVTRGGVARTVVPTTAAAGGSIAEITWTVRGARRYRPVEPRTVAAFVADGIQAPRPIELVVADGDRVAYASCGHVFLWTPAVGRVTEVGSTSLEPRCNSSTYYAGFGLSQLALAGDRVATTWVGGGNTTVWWLGATSIATGAMATLGEGSATTAGPYVPWRGALAGQPTGAGDLLVFSTWTEAGAPPGSSRIRVSSQTVRRAPIAGCPCPDVATSPGPLVPYDVVRGRIVAGGDNETRVYDGLGALVVSVPVSAAAAQLDGSDLVISVRGALLVHDVATGLLRHRWSLTDAPAAAPCARLTCRRDPTTLVLEDAARGLAAYTLGGQVHVVRLADGTDTTVASGTAARFMDSGLVVLDGRNLRLLRYERLPQP